MSSLTKPTDEFQAHPKRVSTSTHPGRYTMLVLATDGADAVEAAGGLLFDRASAGWIVDVRTALLADETAFRILGVPVGVLADAVATVEEWPDAFLVSGRLHGQDAAVRKLVHEAASHSGTDVAMWGGQWAGDLERGVARVEHRLSHAAAAFKSHAMAAAGLPLDAGTVEEFFSRRAGFALSGLASASP